MTDWNPKANEIFLEALDVIDPVARRDFVTRRCAGNDSLRDVVEALLADAANVGSSFLAQPAANELRQLNDDSLETQSPQGANEIAPVRELGTTCASTRNPNAPCTMIGPYKLLPCIGEAPILKLRFLAPPRPFFKGRAVGYFIVIAGDPSKTFMFVSAASLAVWNWETRLEPIPNSWNTLHIWRNPK